MMASLVEPMRQALGEGIETAELRALYDAEMTEMATIHETESAHGWMACRDLLSGETANEKAQQYYARTSALAEAGRYLERHDNAFGVLADLLQARSIPQAVQESAGVQHKEIAGPESVVEMREAELAGRSLTPSMRAFQAMTPAQRDLAVRLPGQTWFSEDAGVVCARLQPGYEQMRAFTYSTGTGGILPTDRMAMPYRLISALDFFNIYPEPGSIIRYFAAQTPVLASSTGAARSRARGAAINEANAASTLSDLPKRSLAVYAEVPLEDIRDHGMVLPRTREQLDIYLRQEMERQIFSGDKSGTEWTGFLGELDTAAANIGALAITSNTVPVLASGDDREPVAFFEQLMVHLGMRDDMLPNVIFASPATIEVIRQSQRSAGLRNLGQDYMNFPYGQINFCALHPCRYLGANEAVVMQSMNALDVVTGQLVDYQTSEHAAFPRNNLALRMTVDGNVALTRPYCAIKVTATNNFVAATSS